MTFEPGEWYHIYNRGIDRQKIFITHENYLFFLRKVRVYLRDYCDVIAYCLMPNHFHFLILSSASINELPSSLNQKIGTLLSSYAQAFNKQERRTGSLFQASTKAKSLLSTPNDRNYPLLCFNYVHQNPMRAGLVSDLKDWPFSSYRDYAGYRKGTLPAIEIGIRSFDFQSVLDFREKTDFAITPDLVKNLY